MARANSWGSRSNKERRKAVADKNAQAEIIDCVQCNSRHRKGRHK